jgi:hypothetical protein
MKPTLPLIVSVLIIAIVLMAGCASTSQPDYVVPTSTPTPTSIKIPTRTYTPTSTPMENLQLIEAHQTTGDYGVKYIAGSIKNNAGKTYSYVQVTINLYDTSGAQVGSTLANVNNLEPGGIWKFKAVVINADDATNFKVKEITGF